MKKTLALVISIALILSVMVVPASAASAYIGINATGGNELKTLTLPETLKLQWHDTPIPDLTYTYAISQTATIVEKDGVPYGAADAVDGAPTIKIGTSGTAGASAALNYSTKTESDVTRSATEYGSTISDDVIVDFSNVKFSEPGIYRYTLTKTASGSDSTAATNNEVTKAIDVVVTDPNNADGKLEVVTYISNGESGSTDKDNNYEDQFPKSRSDLTIVKNVSGAQASKDQYFKITVSLNGTIAGTEYTVDLTHADATTEATVYDAATHVNPATITVPGGATAVSQDFYLKHGQSITIKNITQGISYTIVEDPTSSKGYTVSAAVTGDTEGVTNTAGTDGTVTDTSLDSSTTVTYTNTKAPYVPTGIELQSGAPIMGILMVAGLLAVVLIGKRKKEEMV